MANIKIKCYCGKFLDDPTHKETHQDKFLTEKEYLALDSKITEAKVRANPNDPWKIILSKRIGSTFHMIGIYKP